MSIEKEFVTIREKEQKKAIDAQTLREFGLRNPDPTDTADAQQLKARVAELESQNERFRERLRQEEAAKKHSRKSGDLEQNLENRMPELMRQSLQNAIESSDFGQAWNIIDKFVRFDDKLPTLLRHTYFLDEVTKVYGRHFKPSRKVMRSPTDTIPGNQEKPIDTSTIITPAGMGRLGIIFLDLDDFKKLNDSRGHLAGDAALKKVAEVLLEGLREADIKGRFGGEEIEVAIEIENEGDHFRVAEKIRRLISAAVIQFGGSQFKVTASIGAIELQLGESLEEAIERANWAMKYAKNHGKNLAVPEEVTEVRDWIAEQKSKELFKKITEKPAVEVSKE